MTGGYYDDTEAGCHSINGLRRQAADACSPLSFHHGGARAGPTWPLICRGRIVAAPCSSHVSPRGLRATAAFLLSRYAAFVSLRVGPDGRWKSSRVVRVQLIRF